MASSNKKDSQTKNDMIFYGMELIVKTVLEMCEVGEKSGENPEKTLWRIKNYLSKLIAEDR